MQRKLYRFRWLLYSSFSGILTAYSIMYLFSWVGWIVLIPLLLSIGGKTKSVKSFLSGFVYGICIGLIMLYWIYIDLPDYTGWSYLISFSIYLTTSLLVGLWFGFLLVFIQLIILLPIPYLIKGFAIATVWSGFELLLSHFTQGLPWLGFYLGNMVLKNIFLVQMASFGGLHLLSFFIVLVNYLFLATFHFPKRFKHIILPLSLIAILLISGVFLFRKYEQPFAANPASFTLLNEHLSPKVKWASSTGDMLAQRFFQLNQQLKSYPSDFVVWNESSIPWTYAPDDDFLEEVFRINSSSPAIHIIGMNTDGRDGSIYNSVYCLSPQLELGQYDKQQLLYFLEQPVRSFLFPLSILGVNQELHIQAGPNKFPIPTPLGKLGILICNESTLSSSASNMVLQGAELLVYIANDGWVTNNYLSSFHFYYSRLRAVETRKDVVLNSNMGICGKVTSSGRIEVQHRFNNAGLLTVQGTFNSFVSWYTHYPYLWYAIMCLFTFSGISYYLLINLKNNKK